MSAVRNRSVSQKRQDREAHFAINTSWVVGIREPPSRAAANWTRQMAKHSARAGRRAPCPRSHIGVTSITIKSRTRVCRPEADPKGG